MIKAIIFDCFGVLVVDALAVMRDKLKESSPEEYREAVEILHSSHRGLITPDESNTKLAKLLGLTELEYRRQLLDNEVKNQVLMEYIFTLRANYKTAILSNISAGGIDRRFTNRELTRHFDVVVSSGETGFAKPEAQIYEIAADRLGARLDECVFTDDNEGYCEAARAVGMQAVFYNNFEQFKSELEKLISI